MTEPINAGELELSLRAETAQFLQDIKNAAQQAANQISTDLQSALNNAASSQNQLNQSIQQQRQAASAQLETVKQQYQVEMALAEIHKRSLEVQLEEGGLNLKELQAEKEALQIQKQSSAELEERIATQKKGIASLEAEIEKTQTLRIEAEKYRQILREAGSQTGNGLMAVSIYQAAREQLSNQRLSARYAEIENEKQASIKATLDQSDATYKSINATLAKSAEYSKQIKDQTNVDILKTQSSRAVSSGVFGGGAKAKAESNRDQGIKLEEVQLEQRLSEEKRKYLANINLIVSKGKEYLSLLEQGGASEAAISQTKEKQKAQVQSLLKDYQGLRSELKDLSAERIKNIDAEFQKTKASFSASKFFFKEIAEGLANQLGSLVTNLIAAPINQAINLLRSAVSGIVGQISASLDAFKNYESLKVTVNIASQGQGAEAFSFLEKAAAKYKVQLDTLADSYSGFVASSLAAGNNLNETNYIFERLVLTGRALNLSNEDVKGSMEAVSQMFSKGKIQAEELRGQLGDRFPGALQVMAAAIGVSTQELNKMLEQGQLTTDTLFAFAKKLEDQYGSKLPEALKTTNATAADLQNQIFNLQKDFGESINPINQAALEAASEILENISRGAFTQIKQRSEEIRDYLRQNPEIIKNISDQISKLLTEGLNYVADKAKELLKYLKENPKAIEQAVSQSGAFLKGLGDLLDKAINLTREFAKWDAELGKSFQRFDEANKKFGESELGKLLRGGLQNLDTVTGGLFGLKGLMQLATQPTGETSTDSYKTGTANGQQYGDSRDGGSRKHAGVDLDIQANGKAISFAGGVVSYIGNDPGGYGNYVDVYNPQTKLTERLAEMAEVVVKLGQQVAPGQVVGKGESSTGVIHFEVRTDGNSNGAGSGFTGSINPLDYLRNNNLADVSSSGGETTVKPKQIYGPAPVGTSSGSGNSSIRSNSSSGSSSKPITDLSASKTAPPISITQNRNVDGYLNRLSFLESTHNPGAYNSELGAKGAFQFTPPTVSDALRAGLPDPTKGSLQDQGRAAWLFIKQFHPEAAKAIESGDFTKADRLLKGRWSSLPGGGESQSSERMTQANAYLTNGSGKKFSINASGIKEEDITPGASAEELANQSRSEMKQYQNQAKKAERDRQDAQLRQVRQERDNQIALAKADSSSSEEGKKIIDQQAALLKIKEAQTDARKEANRSIEDKEEELRQLKGKPLQFGENKTQRDQAINNLQNLINTLKAARDRIDKTFGDQIKARETEYQRAVEKDLQKLQDDRAQFELTSQNNTRKALNELAASSLDVNSYDRQRQALQFDNENLDADAQSKKLPLQQKLSQAEKGLADLETAFSKLPKEMQEAARNDPRYKLLLEERDFIKDQIADVDSTTGIQKRTNENKAQAIDKSQAKAIQSASNSADDELSLQVEQNYRSSLEGTQMNPLDINDRVNALSRSNAVTKINRDLEENIQNLKESGTWTQELEDKLRSVAAIKIDNLRFQFKDLATTLKDELNGQFKTFFDGLDGGFKSFFQDIISGNKSIGDSFKQLFSSILSQLTQLVVSRLFTQLLGGKGIGGLFQTQAEPGFGGGILGLGASLLGAFSGGGGLAASAFTGAANFGIGSGFSIPKFAGGGIVQGRAGGGLAILGDNSSGYEAVVPLGSGGRAIGVEFKGSRSSVGGINSNASIEVTINNNGASISSNAGGQLGRDFEEAVKGVIAKQLRPRGILAS